MVKHFRLSRLALSIAAVAALSLPVANAQGPVLKPEKTTLEVAIAATGPLYLPLLLAADAGYFDKRGLKVNLTQLSATASAQALLSGTVDIYQGGTATIHANVAGSDVIYIGAAVDKSTLVLFGQKGITTFDGLRGKAVATTSVGERFAELTALPATNLYLVLSRANTFPRAFRSGSRRRKATICFRACSSVISPSAPRLAL